MSILKVSCLGNPVLRRQAQRLTRELLLQPATQQLIDNMVETMYEYHGVGLAAPQVHESLALAVIESQGPRGEIPLTVLVNPEVKVVDETLLEDWEGCLSVPDLRGRVPRFRKLHVKAWDRNGSPTEFVAENFFARVVQHELDHLLGHVYLDRMPDLGTLTFMEEFQRYWLPENA
jgi:peptide deformylase